MSGRAGDEDCPLLEPQIVHARLEEVLGDPERLHPHCGSGVPHRRPGDRPASARVGPDAEADEIGVPVDDDHVVELDGQLVRGDLGEDGVVSLAARARSRQHDDLARRIDAHRPAFVWAERRLLDVAGDADAEIATLGSRSSLLLSERVVADQRESAAERKRVVAGVVDDLTGEDIPDTEVERQLLGHQHVAPPNLGWVEAALASDHVHHPVHRLCGLDVSHPPERVHRGLVGHRDNRRRLEVRDPVRAAEHRHADERLHEREPCEIGTRIGDCAVAQADDDAVVVVPDLELVDLLPAVGGGEEMLPPILDPLDRTAQPPGEQCDEDLLGVDLELRPESATDVGCDDTHLRRR